VTVIIALAVLPDRVLDRYSTIFGGHSNEVVSNEAVGSQMTREYLLRTSINFTLAHPLFGVGPGQFADNEGTTARGFGHRGAWQVAHNSYTQASSEAGIPAFLFAIAAIIATFVTLNRTLLQARGNPAFRGIAAAAFCLMLSLVVFSAACFFLSMIYRFYFPALAGLAVGFAAAAQREFASAQSSPALATQFHS